jgi:hypothetical protein
MKFKVTLGEVSGGLDRAIFEEQFPGKDYYKRSNKQSNLVNEIYWREYAKLGEKGWSTLEVDTDTGLCRFVAENES